VPDPRITPVETNLFAWRRVFLDVPDVVDRSAADVQACSSSIPLHLFNGICEARFQDWAARAREVIGEYVDRGVPWFWWVTPSTTAPELEAALAACGASQSVVPGMHLELAGWSPRVTTEIETAVVSPAEPISVDTLMTGFGVPEAFREPVLAHGAVLARTNSMSVLGLVDGEPVGGGLAVLADRTVGLYMIATLEGARGRGVGLAVTQRLLAEARDRGATDAVLHTTALGRGVYERVGFEVVCDTAQWAWRPTS
jgi:ribosomal protein S18 acetylase RimI-like enzyme